MLWIIIHSCFQIAIIFKTQNWPANRSPKRSAESPTPIGPTGLTTPLWEPNLVDELVAVPTESAKAMARALARREGLFAGTSSGANVIGAIEIGRKLGPDATIVTLMVDSGLKYMSTDMFGR